MQRLGTSDSGNLYTQREHAPSARGELRVGKSKVRCFVGYKRTSEADPIVTAEIVGLTIPPSLKSKRPVSHQ